MTEQAKTEHVTSEPGWHLTVTELKAYLGILVYHSLYPQAKREDY